MSNIHVTHNPAGTYSFVGTLPIELGNIVPATRAAILGNATLNQRGPNNEAMMVRFPVFATRAGAILHADARGFPVSGA